MNREGRSDEGKRPLKSQKWSFGRDDGLKTHADSIPKLHQAISSISSQPVADERKRVVERSVGFRRERSAPVTAIQ